MVRHGEHYGVLVVLTRLIRLDLSIGMIHTNDNTNLTVKESTSSRIRVSVGDPGSLPFDGNLRFTPSLYIIGNTNEFDSEADENFPVAVIRERGSSL